MSELYLFDTSALIEFAVPSARSRWIASQLDESVAHTYHLVSLSELARQSHPEAHGTDQRAEDRARQRRGLITVLGEHRKAGRQLLYGRRFLPLPIAGNQLTFAAELSRELSSACYDRRGEFHAPCSLADHLIVCAGVHHKRLGCDVTIVTGDHHQLEVAHRLGLTWVYARGHRGYDARPGPFPWGDGTARWIH